MDSRNVIWLPTVREKLLQYRSRHFTPEETFHFIFQFILETEELLKIEVVTKYYTEEFGKYKGLSKIVIKKFRIYFKKDRNNIIVLAVLFPGEI